MILLLIIVVLVIGALLAGLLAGGATIGLVLLVIGFIALIIKLLTKSGSDNSVQVNVDNRQIQQRQMPKSAFEDDIGFITDKAQKDNDDKSIVIRFQPASDRDVPDAIKNSIERAFIALNSFQFDEAKVYFDRVLDADPHFAPAYLGKLLCKLKIRDEKNLVFSKAGFTKDPNWDSALRFATEEELSRYKGYLESARVERKKIQDKREEEARRQAVIEAEDAARARKKAIKAITIIILLACIGVGGYFLTTGVIIPYIHYNNGMSNRTSGQWDAAVSEFEQAGEYNDALAQIPETRYLEGLAKREKQDWDGAVAAFTAAGSYKDANDQICETRYTEGISRREAKEWNKAIIAFTASGEYKKDANSQILETYYQEGENYRDAGLWFAAMQAFTSAGSYKDSEDQRIIMTYNYAMEKHHSGKYKEAHDLFISIIDYKDVRDVLLDINYVAVEARKKQFTVGNTVRFGHYEQDCNTENGSEEIEWIVLNTTKGKSLLISKYVLDAKPYDEDSNSSWEKSTLRKWLNQSFFVQAFNDDEKKTVMLSNLNNSHGTSGYYNENSTDDNVFILSVSEVSSYFKSNESRICFPTDYALTKGVGKAKDTAVTWWTRTRGIHSLVPYRAATYIDSDGSTDDYFKTMKSCGVRPVVWIDLESDYFWRNDKDEHKPYYDVGVAKREAQLWDEAVEAFVKAENYEDATTQILITRYQEGLTKQADKDWDGAVIAFMAAGDYEDATTQILITRYQEGLTKQADKDWDGAVIAFTAAGDYEDATTQILITRYQEGLTKQADKDWDGAVIAFAAVGDYEDAQMQIQKVRYDEGKFKLNENDMDGAIKAFRAAGDYEDAEMQIQDIKYNQGKKLYEEGNYVDAYLLFDEVKGYQDAENMLKKDKNLKAVAHEAKTKPFRQVGNRVTFGQYEQDNNDNGLEKIEWIVLAVEDGKSLLISAYCLDTIPFNAGNYDCTWETCTLRNWLNKDFINTAFSKTEQAAILVTYINNNPTNSLFEALDNGANTEDKIFILNKYEATEVYYSSDTARQCEPTFYAVAQCSRDDHKVYGWWLRSTEHGIIGQYANYVNVEGKCSSEMVGGGFIGIRPVMWVNLESKAFQ